MTEPDNNLIFYGTRGPRNAKIMVVGESWGAQEEGKKLPFVGGSGQELDRMLAEAGIDPQECFFTNVVSAKPAGNDMSTFFYHTQEVRSESPFCVRGLYPKPIVTNSLKVLEKQIELVNPDFIIGFGNYSLWALTEDSFRVSNATSKVDRKGRKVPTGIASFRGSQLRTRAALGSRPFLPTFHPAAILRQWAWRAPAVHDLRVRFGKYREGSWDPPRYNFLIRPSFSDAKDFLESLLRDLDRATIKLPVAVDLETRAGHIACIGFGVSSRTAACIPLMCVEDPTGYWTYPEECVLTELIVQVLSHPKLFLVGQNFLYDAQYIARHWYYKVRLGFGDAHDTMNAQHTLYPGTPKGLDYLSSLYCHHHVYWKDDGKLWDPKVGEDQLWNYNCLDDVKTFEVAQKQLPVIDSEGLSDPWRWECNQLPLMLDMMLRGVLIDGPMRGKQTFELNDAIQERIRDLEIMIPWGDILRTKSAKSPWYSSPKQQMRLFYEELGLKTIRNRKTQAPSVDDEALQLIMRREPILTTLIETISELRSCRVFHDNFLASRLDDDGRMRCSYNPHPETFRWSSSESAFGTGTNLQNIPKGTED